MIVISTGPRKFGLVVDRLVGEEELVMKALEDKTAASDLVSGASILGDGTVVLDSQCRDRRLENGAKPRSEPPHERARPSPGGR